MEDGMFLSHLERGKARGVFDALNTRAQGKELQWNPRNERISAIQNVVPSHLTLLDSFVPTIDVSNLDLVALVKTSTIST